MKVSKYFLQSIIREEIDMLGLRDRFITLDLSNIKINVEVASCPVSRNRGLMYRNSIKENCGMLFAFPKTELQSFWMKNTKIPLSIAFINENGLIINIENMVPFELNSSYSSGPAKFALEMNQGWFVKNNIRCGDIIKGLPKKGIV